MGHSTKVGALNGVQVIEIGDEISEWCGKLLADMGADIIKVEPLEGSRTRKYEPFYKNESDINQSLYFWHYNTSKKSISLNLATKEGRSLFMQLLKTSDVLLDGMPFGYLANLGIEYSECNRANPSIITAAITPFGQGGAYSDRASTDLTAMAFGGPVWSCGYDDHSTPPIRGSGNQAFHTVCHFATIGIMTALLHKQLTGFGQFVDANMHAALNVTTEGATYNWLVAQDTVQRQTGRHASINPTPPSQILCKDGRYINVGFPARTEEQWFHLLSWLDEEGLIGNLGDFLNPPNWDAMRRGDSKALEQQRIVMSSVEQLAQRLDSYEMFTKAQNLGFQWGIIYSPDEVLDDPHFAAREFLVTVDHPELNSSFIYPGAPYKLPESPWKIRSRAPFLGEHNEEVFIDLLDIPRRRFNDLIQKGII